MSKYVFVCGFPASGKTTLAKKLEVELGYPVIDRDCVREVLRKYNVAEPLLNTVSYESSVSLCADNNHAIVCAPFLYYLKDYDRFKSLLNSANIDLKDVTVLFLTHDKDLERSRIIKRNEDKDSDKIEDLDKYFNTYYPNFKIDSRIDFIPVSQSYNIAALIDQIKGYNHLTRF